MGRKQSKGRQVKPKRNIGTRGLRMSNEQETVLSEASVSELETRLSEARHEASKQPIEYTDKKLSDQVAAQEARGRLEANAARDAQLKADKEAVKNG